MNTSSPSPLCARESCTNPVEQPATGGHPRRYCSDTCRAADRRARLARERVTAPPSADQEPSDLGAQLVTTATTLARLALAVRAALVSTGADATQARVIGLEAAAAERIAAAERRLAGERQARLAAEEAAVIAEERRETAERDCGLAQEEAARAQEEAAEAERQVRAVVEALEQAEVKAEATLAAVRQELQTARNAAEARAGAAEAREAEVRRQIETIREAADHRVAAVEARSDAMVAQVRTDAGERMAAERGMTAATVATLTGERDRLVAQAARDAEALAVFARTMDMAEARASTLTAELAILRLAPASPQEETPGGQESR